MTEQQRRQEVIRIVQKRVSPRSSVRVHLAQAGALVQVIDTSITDSNKTQISQQLFSDLLTQHQTHPHLDCFPHTIFVYSANGDQFKVMATLRIRAHSYENGIHTTYSSAGDGHLWVSEVDAAALGYGATYPVTIEGCQENAHQNPFQVIRGQKYLELDLEGGISVQEVRHKSQSNDLWEIIVS